MADRDERDERSFSEYRRLIDYRFEERAREHEKLETEYKQELREVKSEVYKLRSEVTDLSNKYSNIRFKLNWWQAAVASIPGWITLGLYLLYHK